jgi:hypothetical protein
MGPGGCFLRRILAFLALEPLTRFAPDRSCLIARGSRNAIAIGHAGRIILRSAGHESAVARRSFLQYAALMREASRFAAA